jgi:hypothetical protein
MVIFGAVAFDPRKIGIKASDEAAKRALLIVYRLHSLERGKRLKMFAPAFVLTRYRWYGARLRFERHVHLW